MPRPDPARHDLLLVGCHRGGLGALGAGLERSGYSIDRVDTVEAVRGAFFAAGGHDAVVLGPELPTNPAEALLRDLLSLDEELRVVVFGRYGYAFPSKVTRLTDLHPAAPNALGAVQRALLD